MKKTLITIMCIACISTTLYGCGKTDIAQTTPVIESETTTSNSNQEWKQFLTDYEAWVDEYVVFMEKYKENPTDSSLLSESVKLAEKAIEWSQKAETYQKELEDADVEELTEYLETLGRITEKLATVTN